MRIQKIQINQLEGKVLNNKIFLYMVIHDLKHPTESMISQLGQLMNELCGHSEQLQDIIRTT
jgi:hypothetical protein